MTNYYYFTIDSYPKPLGYVHYSIVHNITWPRYWTIDQERRRLHLQTPADGGDLFDTRTRLINATISRAKAEGKIKELCWTGEPVRVLTPEGEHLFNMNNGGSQLFGVLSFGVHLIAWTMTSEGKKYWIQRRSMEKGMHPGKLDTTAGGGIKLGETAFAAMIRESEEEASIPADIPAAHLKSCGIVSYHLDYSFLDNPGSYPHVLHVFEMELPAEVTPRPNDGEVSEFLTMTEDEVMKALFEDDFKPIVGIQWVAHFCRHGVLTPENEPRLLEMSARMHRNLATFFSFSRSRFKDSQSRPG